MEDIPGTFEIPVWVEGSQKWLTGVTKRTTCDDVIYALLYNDDKHEADNTQAYTVHERWRDVERPLQGRTKILKVWNAWDSEQCNVKFSMKRTDGISGEYSITRRRHKRTRHKSKHMSPSYRHEPLARKHEIKLKSLESLVKLVISQEKKLQNICHRIKETDALIEKYETKLHLNRVQANGKNYVQKAYLDSNSDESMEDFLSNASAEKMQEYIVSCEKLLRLEDNLLDEQNIVQDLTVQIKENSASAHLYQLSHVTYEYAENYSYGTMSELEREIHRSVAKGMMQKLKFDETMKEISFFEAQMNNKNATLRTLSKELEESENCNPARNCTNNEGGIIKWKDVQVGYTNDYLQSNPQSRATSAIIQSDTDHQKHVSDNRCNVDASGHITNALVSESAGYPYYNSTNLVKYKEENDSNSDTGLSSMHSDEISLGLETLV